MHGMLFAAFVGILGGALPARRASRVTLMEALRM
jgi:ABC-type antimicrobial peptide transport system permease subunit